MRKGESKVIPGDMAQQQTAAGPQELPMLRHRFINIRFTEKNEYLNYTIYIYTI